MKYIKTNANQFGVEVNDGAVRSHRHIRVVPERTGRWQRFDVKHVQNGMTQPTASSKHNIEILRNCQLRLI